MNRRSLFLLKAITFLGLVIFCGFLWLTVPLNRINEESFELIKNGITEKEVIDIFGVPPGDYGPSTNKRRVYPSSNLWIPAIPVEEKKWKRNGLAINIYFNEAGNVVHSQMSGEPSETFFDKLSHFLQRVNK